MEINDRIEILERLNDLVNVHYRESDDDGFLRCERCGQKVSKKYFEEVIQHEAKHFDSG